MSELLPIQAEGHPLSPKFHRLGGRSALEHPDGRPVLLYGDYAPAHMPERATGEPLSGHSPQRRWHPLRREWVLVAARRQGRSFLPTVCPLCPTTQERLTEIPASAFEVAVFPNRFPALRDSRCEVVVYSDQHLGCFAELSSRRMQTLMDVWRDRYLELGSQPDVQYVFIFENRGEAVGVTLHHPHGQIYAYPFIPPVAATELRAGRAHLRRTSRCLQCSILDDELKTTERVLFADDGVVAFVPSYARWPYEVHVTPAHHSGALPDLSSSGRARIGEAMQRIARSYDRLFDQPMPYMMVMHQRPTDNQPHPEAHLRVEFYPVMRSPGRLKFLAGGECGAGTFVSDGLPEEKAAELKRVL